LAAQLFSRSVALGLRLCRETSMEGFANSNSTETFILQIDTLFDYLNSQKPTGLGFKAPLSIKNINDFQNFVARIEGELMHLKMHKESLFIQVVREQPYWD
jgi:hypothetical protein